MGLADKIFVGRQGKYVVLRPGENTREEILAQAMGRSGGLRAPTLRRGKLVLVGFSEDMYNHLV